MVLSQEFTLILHSFFEMLPISSSWHLQYFFAVSSAETHVYHIWLLPAVLLLLYIRSKKSDFPSWVIVLCAAIPSLFFYFGIKFKMIAKWPLPIEWLHLIIGLGLMLAAYRQITLKNNKSSPLSSTGAWMLIGLGQAISMRIPGSSRFGTSLLPGIFFKMPFRESLIISYTLDCFCLVSSLSLDIAQQTLILPSIPNLLIATLGFAVGWLIVEKWQWHIIGFLGFYRVCLGCILLGLAHAKA